MTTLLWNPKKTRAFIVGLAKFEDEEQPSFSTHDRTEPALVETLKKRGVPANQIVLLQDSAATTENVKNKFLECLHASKPGEQLIFYFGSHGSYAGKQGEFWFSTFDDFLPFEWAFDTIEQEFKGNEAMLFPDCCYSGGMVDLLPQRTSRISYAVLSSTFAHNVAWSGWRFLECVVRGLAGDARMDVGLDGHVDWQDLCQFTEKYMAFVAEGKPSYATTGSFNPHLGLAEVSEPLKDPQIGQCLEVLWKDKWYRAEILEVRGDQFKIHYTSYSASSDEWVTIDRMRGQISERFWVGAPVEIQASSSKKWYPGRVLDTWENMHFCRYDNYGPEYDEWFGPSRIRKKGSQ